MRQKIDTGGRDEAPESAGIPSLGRTD